MLWNQEFKRLALKYGLTVSVVPISEHHGVYCCEDIEIWEVTRIDLIQSASLSSASTSKCSNGNIDSYLQCLMWGDDIPDIPCKLFAHGQYFDVNIQQLVSQGRCSIGNHLWASSVIASRYSSYITSDQLKALCIIHSTGSYCHKDSLKFRV